MKFRVSSKDLIIYPNPGNEIVNIEYDITNSNGYLVVSKIDNTIINNYILDSLQNIKKIDVSEYPNGYYVFTVIKNGNIESSKLFLKN